MKTTRTVLITAIGCNTSISAAKCLRASKRYNYKIVGVDVVPQHEAAGSIWCDVYHQVPNFSDTTYIAKIIEITQKENAGFVISVMDDEMEILAQQALLFKDAGICLCIPEFSVITRCNDKFETNAFLASHGVVIPRTYTHDETVSAAQKFPLFVKPRKGVSSINCYKVEDADELKIFLARIHSPIVQEYISGDQYVIDVVNDMTGKNLTAIPRRELSAKAGIGVKAVTIDDQELVAYGKKVSELLGITGAANIEVFKKDGEIILIEVNPRFSAGTIISCAAGVNTPEIVLDVYAGESIEPERLSWRSGIYMTRYWQEVFSDTICGTELAL